MTLLVNGSSRAPIVYMRGRRLALKCASVCRALWTVMLLRIVRMRLLKKPNVYGSIFRFEGQSTIFAYPGGPCYRCLYPEPPPPGLVPSCAEGGVLGILPGIIGLVQATEAVKLILGAGEPLIGRLMLYDALAMRFRELKLRRNPECPVCGDNPTIKELIDYHQFCGVPNPKDVQPEPEPVKSGFESDTEIDVVALKSRTIPAATVTLVSGSIRMNEPVEALRAYSSSSNGVWVRRLIRPMASSRSPTSAART